MTERVVYLGWRCTNCGEILTALDDASVAVAWRWNGEHWEHRCESLHPQASYKPAVRVQASVSRDEPPAAG